LYNVPPCFLRKRKTAPEGWACSSAVFFVLVVPWSFHIPTLESWQYSFIWIESIEMAGAGCSENPRRLRRVSRTKHTPQHVLMDSSRSNSHCQLAGFCADPLSFYRFGLRKQFCYLRFAFKQWVAGRQRFGRHRASLGSPQRGSGARASTVSK
jgi:hypothetical protein